MSGGEASPRFERLSDAMRRRIISQINLQDVIGRDVALKRESGKIHSGLSPFSAERSPSFNVWRDHYHCFSTGQHGDVFTWLMEVRGLSFPQAVKEARVLAGLEEGQITRTRLKEIDRTARKREEDEAAYQARMIDLARQLVDESRPVAGTPVCAYLRGRAIDPEVLGGWPAELGYHPRVKNRSGEYFRAMIHPVRQRGAVGARGDITGAHVTFLTKDPAQGWVKVSGVNPLNGRRRASKQMYGQCFTGAAQLWGDLSLPSKEAPQDLYLGEGLESVMSARQLGLLEGWNMDGAAHWAGLSLGNVTGAQARDRWNKPLFTLPKKSTGRRLFSDDLPRGVPVPDLNRPGFLPPEGWTSTVRIVAEDDLKDDIKNKIPGRQRARESFFMAAAKFRQAAKARGVTVIWPPAGGDANDALRAYCRSQADASAALPPTADLTEFDRKVMAL